MLSNCQEITTRLKLSGSWVRLLMMMLVSIPGIQSATAQKDAVAEINTLLKTQQDDWNRGDIDAFMQGYWKSDSLQFIGSNGINHGWQQTLDGYKKRYPDGEAMGELTFKILQHKKISSDAYAVTGNFYLKRSIGDLSGIFTLLVQKKNGKWVITYDHTS